MTRYYLFFRGSSAECVSRRIYFNKSRISSRSRLYRRSRALCELQMQVSSDLLVIQYRTCGLTNDDTPLSLSRPSFYVALGSLKFSNIIIRVLNFRNSHIREHFKYSILRNKFILTRTISFGNTRVVSSSNS